jgi:hypothetical protein
VEAKLPPDICNLARIRYKHTITEVMRLCRQSEGPLDPEYTDSDIRGAIITYITNCGIKMKTKQNAVDIAKRLSAKRRRDRKKAVGRTTVRLPVAS